MIAVLFVIIITPLSLLWPEISFALFLCAGAFKADPHLAIVAEYFDPTILLFLLTLIGIAGQAIRKQVSIAVPDLQLLIPYCIIVMLMLFGLMYTPAPIYGHEKAVRFLTLSSFALFIPGPLFSRPGAFSRFLLVFTLCAVVFSIITLFANIGTTSHLDYQSGLEGASYLLIGRIAGMGALICLFYYIIRNTQRSIQIINFCVFVILMSGLMIAGGRGPLIALLVSIILTTAIMFLRRKGRIETQNNSNLIVINIVIVLVGFVLLYIYADYFERIYYRLEEFNRFGSGKSTSERMYMIQSVLDAFQEIPTLIGGLGVGGFSIYYDHVDAIRGVYPHNLLLESAIEMGLIATGAIVAWIIFSIRKLREIYHKNTQNGTILTALIIFNFINSLVSGDLNDNRLLYYCIGTIITYSRNELT